MPLQTRHCLRCGYENVPRALFCFQCGRSLDDTPFSRALPGTSQLMEDAHKYIKDRGQKLEPEMIDQIRNGRVEVPPNDLSGEPLTCLRCGMLNSNHAAACVNCGAALLIPDLDFNLIARTSARTSIGRVRSNNEDNVNIWAIEGIVLALVADGMGGAAAGEEASRLAVEAIQADFLGESRGSQNLQILSESALTKRLTESVQNANQAVFEKAQGDSARKGMGTTSTLMLIRGNRALIAHVGDSRAYIINGHNHEITQITDDHSFVQALVASGHITQEQAKKHPMHNVLYRALGQSLDLEVDTYTHFLKAGDRLVLCSDGLVRHVPPEDIAKLTLATDSPDEAALNLIELTNERGAEDNVSVIVTVIEEVQKPVMDARDPDPDLFSI